MAAVTDLSPADRAAHLDMALTKLHGGGDNEGRLALVAVLADPATSGLIAPGGSGTTTITSAKGAMTNRSGTIATGGVSQTLAPANAGRNYLLIQNPSTATASIWIDFAGVAAVLGSPSVELGPGTTLIYEGTWLPTGAITVIAASSGAAYTAKEG